MLEKLVLKNFKTFKNETIINLAKTNYTILPQNVSDNGILKGSIFIGPNASGKSTVIEAIKILLDLLFKESPVHTPMFRCLFSKENDFSLHYYFNINNTSVIYKINIDVVKKYIKESLAVDNENNIIFERNGNSAFSKISNDIMLNYDKNNIDNDSLFLRTLYFNTKFTGNETLRQWMEFLQESIYIDAVNKRISYYDKENIKLSDYLKQKGTKEINSFFNAFQFPYSIEYTNTSEGNLNILEYSENKEEKYVFFKRKQIDEPIPYINESMGNKSLLQLLPGYLHIINTKGMLLIDEFSSGFHPLLEKTLLKNFMKNAKESQFIFVSHSVSLVSNSILRPDQVYAIDFDGSNGSKIIRFSDMQPRTAQNIEKMYLSGIFGALPVYGEVIDDL